MSQINEESLFTPAPFLFVRTARLPIDYLLKLWKGEENLKLLLQENDLIKEAIEVASSTLFNSSLEKNQALLSLFKYITRMASRATPFGLFSFVSFGRWCEKTSIEFDLSQVKKRARPDMEWLIKVIDQISIEITPQLIVKRNPLLFESMGRIILPFSREQEKKKDQVSIRASALVRMILGEAQNSKKIDLLIENILKRGPQFESEKVLGVIRTLLNEEILISNFLPNLLCEDAFQEFLEELEQDYKGSKIGSLCKVQQMLENYNTLSPGSGEAVFKMLKNEMNNLVSADHLLQVDSFYPKEVLLSQDVAKEATKVADFLWKLSFARKNRPILENYHTAFIEKYGTTRLVPLLDLFDPHIGLGTPESYQMTGENQNAIQENVKFKEWLHEQWFQCVFQKKEEIILTEEVIQFFKTEIDEEKLPRSFDLSMDIVSSNFEAINKGDFTLLFLPFFGASGGCASLGRFLVLFEENERHKVSQFIHAEEALEPGSIFIECSYFPSSARSANVAMHPNFRKWQLNLGNNKEVQNCISLEQIFVGSTGKRFYFTFQEGGKELLFTVSNFLNPQFAPHILRFLRDACEERFNMPLPFSWGSLENMPYLPRVRYGKSILCSATWRPTLSLIEAKENETSEAIASKFKNWAEKNKLPRYLYQAQSDNRLLLDRNCPLALQEIAQQLKKMHSISLVEKISMNEWVKSDQGSHCNEFVIPFLRKKATSEKNYSPYSAIDSLTRIKIPLCEWIFAKLYISKDHESQFLVDYLNPFIQHLTAQSGIEKWFFIRYRDPIGTHLRIRLKTTENGAFKAFSQWTESQLLQGHIKDIVFAVYDREVERYGGEALIDDCETLFQADSEVVLSLLRSIHIKKTNLPDYVIAALSLIDYLKAFDLTIEEQIAFFSHLEMPKKHLEGFRKWKSDITIGAQKILQMETQQEEGKDSIENLLSAFKERKVAQSNMLLKARLLMKNGKLKNDWQSIMHSFLHMHCNRLLGIQSDLEQKAFLYAFNALTVLSFSLPSRMIRKK